MTLDELIEDIERSEEGSLQAKTNAIKSGQFDTATYHDGKTTAFRICLEKLRKYRLSSGAE